MRFRFLSPLFLFALFCGVAACGRSGFLGGGFDPVELAEETPSVIAGDGFDGPLVAEGTMVVNTCHQVVSGNASLLLLDSAQGITAGRRVIVWQTQEEMPLALDDTNAMPQFTAGRWEVALVVSVNAQTIVVDGALEFVYGSTIGRAQLCSFPEFTTVDVPDGTALVAPPWNGETGGILAFRARDGVIVDGSLDATGAGFRGGVPASFPDGTQGVVDLTTTDQGRGGGRGESLDSRAWTEFGRGHRANGGGGGNSFNAGGGGGANGGDGGRGGYEGLQGAGGPGNPQTAGLPGSRSLALPEDRLVLGGGGGAGQWEDVMGGNGGAGGGVILVFASSVTGGGTVIADGVAGTGGGTGGVAEGDGGGGGGAGGTIVVTASASTYSGAVDAAGGDGGDVLEGDDVNDRGPGGGGSGGVVRFPGGGAPVFDLAGGDPGENNGGELYGATAGGLGVQLP